MNNYWNDLIGSTEIDNENIKYYYNNCNESYDLKKYAINKEISNEIYNFCKQSYPLIYIYLLSAIKILFAKYGKDNYVIGCHPVKNEYGMAKIFPFFLQIDLDERKKDVINEVKKIYSQIESNRNITTNELIQLISTKTNNNQFVINTTVVFKKIFKENNYRFFNEKNILAFDFTDEGITLELYCYENDEKSSIDYDVLVSHVELILKELNVNHDQSIKEINVITEKEKQLILNDFNATEAEYPRDKTVVELFEEQVEKTPDNTALVFEENKLTYAELNARANSLANKLRESGVKPDDFVAIIADRSIEMIAGIYGIIKAGGAYVPIDPTYPEDRIRFMLDDCQPKAVLKYTTESITIGNGIPVIDLENREVWEGASENPERVNKPEDLIYCIYTSGTTGKPKGVPNKHKGIVNLISWMQSKYPLSEKDVILQKTTYVFDVSASEIFWWFNAGASLAMLKKNAEKEPEVIAEEIEKYGATVIDFVPSMLSVFMSLSGENIKKIKGLRYVLAAGEALNANLVKEFYAIMKKHGSEALLGNIYGPTEASVYSTYYDLEPNFDGETVLIGKPVANAQAYIMNGENLCGIGVPGELCIAGDGLARGYLNRPELTEEKFVKNPFGEGRMYKTGDLARWLPDGNIEYLGRIDEQVKIRGFRIELGEIESKIREIESIKDCAVIAKADSTGDKAIYAYYTSEEEVSVSEIRDRLSESLPEYMVPAYMMQIDAIPVTRNGKLDKRALPEIEAKAAKEYIAPRNDIEEKICAIFSEILNVEQVGVKDSFFELGGHSLRATRLVNRIEAETGTRIALKDVFIHPTVEQLAVLAGAEAEEYVPIPKAEEKEYYPMSSAQKRTYLIQQMQPDTVTYNMPGMLKLTGEVYPDKLRSALQEMTDRHEILRTRFLMVEGEPVQKILGHIDVDFEYVTSKENDEELMKEFLRPFDLGSGKTIRAKLVDKGEYHLMMFDIHHIVSDGMSMNIFENEIMALYNGEKLEPLTHQFKDYSEWMRSRDLSGQAEYWKNQFDGEIPVLDMPTDYVRPQEQSYEGSTIITTLDSELSTGVKELVKKTGTTEYMVFLAAAMVTLSKYSRQEDIVIGSPISGRTHRDTERMLGMFINTLAMRGNPEKNKTFSEFLEEIKTTCLKAYENQEYPFEELVEAVEVQRDISRNPLFDVMLVMQNNETARLKLGESKIEETGVESRIAKFDLTFNIIENEGRFEVTLQYCTDLYKEETAKRLIEHLEEVLRSVAANTEQKLGEIEMVTVEEKSLILNDFNATEAEYPRDKTVVELFEEQAKKTPDNTAVVFEEESLTYAELNARANSLAHKLRELGVKPDDFVAIIADRSIEMIAGIYGIIKAGGAYVPIDPTYPDERIAFMLEDCKPKAVLKYTTESITIDSEIAVIDLADSKVWEGASENPEIVNKPEDAIYCIYTSGTTGKPKGVINRNYGLINRIMWMDGKYPIGTGDTILQKTTFTFDVSVWEVIWWSIKGARVALLTPGGEKEPDTICDFIEKYQVTTMHFVPSMLSMFEEYVQETEGAAERLKSLRNVFASGEALKKSHVENFYKIAESGELGMKLANFYGPTEASIDVTYYDCVVEDKVSVPIGKPIDNTQIYIVNGKELCGIGVPGELCIAGDGLARGYLNRPELTEEKFVKNPFGEGRMYKTGDLARWLPDGNIEYLGRIDEQVKIRGFRIELGEIESKIREIESIKDCAVIAKADSTGDKAIYAYYTSEEEVSVSEIRDRLSESLPEYMVPAYMMQIDAIPVTRNGKLDKRALPEIEAKAAKEYIAPRNDIEEKICAIFSEILNVEQVGVKDSFFELGGHSLRATRLVNRIEAETGTRIALKDVFIHPTVEQLAVLAGAEAEEYVPIPKAEEKEYYPMSSAQKRTYLIQQMQPDTVTYNMPGMLKLTGEVYPDKLRSALQEMTDRHEILRTRFLMVEGEPVQKILGHIDVDFEYVTSKENDEELMKEFLRPFDLGSGKTIRAKLVDKGEYHLMMFDIHHIVSDGMSMNIFENEIMALYNGEKLEPLTHQFKDYSEWMRSRDLSGQAEYWKNQFDGEIPVLDMPTDYVRPQEQSYEGSTIITTLDSELSTGVKELVKKTGTTEYMVFLAAAMVTLSKYSRQEDIVIGSPISGRTHRDTERMLGMFINTLAMRGNPEKNKTFSEFLEEIKTTCLKAYENQEYPFEELVEAVEVQRDISRNPLFDVMLVMQNNETARLKLGESKIEETGVESRIAKFDLTFNIIENEGRFEVTLQYCTDLYKEETAKRLIEHLEEVLRSVAANTEQKLGEIEMVTVEEKSLILNDFNATEAEYPRDKTVVELFEEQAKKTPDNTAVVFEEESLTYAELNARANSLAHKLRELGVKPDDFVAIIADRSIEMIAGIYGIIKAGGAYVPIDPTYPDERIAFMLEDCKPKAVLKYTTESITIDSEIAVIDLADSKVWEGASENPEIVNKPEDAIYCIYTSGTTGKPKGVVVVHTSFTNLVIWYQSKFKFSSYDVNLFIASICFDLGQKNLFTTLIAGGTIIIADVLKYDYDKLSRIIVDNKVTMINCAPSVFNYIIKENSYNDYVKLSSLEKVFLGGEQINAIALRETIKSKNTKFKIINTYGPTECTDVVSSYSAVNERIFDSGVISIGKPIPNTHIYILSDDELSGIGVPGEICISGGGLARGYLNRPELTAEKFVKNPIGEGRMYRTGDLARWLPDGNIEYIGRIDEQVKIRGFRIELGEIESRIREIENIKDCAVVARADSTGDKAIYAYYTSDVEVSVSEIRDKLSERLPEYMMPAYMMQIEDIPVTKNGKLDRRALPEIEARATKEYIAPRNEIEEKICVIFSEILNVGQVGVKDSFFELGGHSLRAAKLVNRIEAETGARISIMDIFTHPTVEQLVKFISLGSDMNQFDLKNVKKEIALKSNDVRNSERKEKIEFLRKSKDFNIKNIMKLSDKKHKIKKMLVFGSVCLAAVSCAVMLPKLIDSKERRKNGKVDRND